MAKRIKNRILSSGRVKKFSKRKTGSLKTDAVPQLIVGAILTLVAIFIAYQMIGTTTSNLAGDAVNSQTEPSDFSSNGEPEVAKTGVTGTGLFKPSSSFDRSLNDAGARNPSTNIALSDI